MFEKSNLVRKDFFYRQDQMDLVKALAGKIPGMSQGRLLRIAIDLGLPMAERLAVEQGLLKSEPEPEPEPKPKRKREAKLIAAVSDL